MSSLSMVEANLPAGFRFHPKDEELICDYLMKKIAGGSDDDQPHQLPFLIQVDLNNCEPWDIPEAAWVGRKESYFYSKRDRKYATGSRTNRATRSGYWKATGKDREVINRGYLVGMRKTLVFYIGRAPKGTKTNWVMHEFRLQGNSPPLKDDIDWVLCRVFHKKKEDSAPNNHVMEMSSGTFSHSQEDDDNKNHCSFSSLPPLEPYILFDENQLPYLDHSQGTFPSFPHGHGHPHNDLLLSTNDITDNNNIYIPNSPSFGKDLSDLFFTEQHTNNP